MMAWISTKKGGMINEGMVDFHPSKRYDVSVSISTLELIGSDEKPKDLKKVLKAIENLKTNFLAYGGIMVITSPLGLNPELDELLKQGCSDLGKQYFLKRLTKENLWKETELKDVQDVKYNSPFPRGNAIVVSIKR